MNVFWRVSEAGMGLLFSKGVRININRNLSVSISDSEPDTELLDSTKTLQQVESKL